MTKLQIQRADLQDRINKNKAWIVSGLLCCSPCTLLKYQSAVGAGSPRQLVQAPPDCWHVQEHFEASKDDGAFEAQYKKLLEEIQQIYESAKEFHSKVWHQDRAGRSNGPAAPDATLWQATATIMNVCPLLHD